MNPWERALANALKRHSIGFTQWIGVPFTVFIVTGSLAVFIKNGKNPRDDEFAKRKMRRTGLGTMTVTAEQIVRDVDLVAQRIKRRVEGEP